ncbi:hypothetical protein [Micromonospora narathiwatensis]|uniref:Uncharacterized protein n=1 Tax=Micromonospora narathiwatensis TaxID=299146 RepID=A0A1A9A4U2_9ACTN|nr:hypothetical protein [Micromonospora narathiwatensis]SBT51131.1 hypothetical protein GA0070621_3943 [Micromonospora narathiwatensis]
MTTPFENLIRATLSDLAEEAPPVQDQLTPAERRVRNRRRTTMALSAAGTIAAVLVATPFAIASTRSDAPRPAAPSARPTPSPSVSFDPSARPSPRESYRSPVPIASSTVPGRLPDGRLPMPAASPSPSPETASPSPRMPGASPSPRMPGASPSPSSPPVSPSPAVPSPQPSPQR